MTVLFHCFHCVFHILVVDVRQFLYINILYIKYIEMSNRQWQRDTNFNREVEFFKNLFDTVHLPAETLEAAGE